MNLVTGATGLLGTHLVLELLQSGRPVRAIKRAQSSTVEMSRLMRYLAPEVDYFSQIEWVEGDVLDVLSLSEAMQGCDHVYHAAAVVSYHKSDRAQMYKTNVVGTANVVNCALEAGIGKLAHVSSIAALGKTHQQSLISEQSEWENSSGNTHYGITKHESELEVWRGIQEGLDALIFCPGFIIGPGDFSRSSASLFTRLHQGLSHYTMGGTGFIAASDCANAMVRMMGSDVVNDRFIVVSENMSMKDLFSEISKAFGKNPPANPAGPMILQLARIAEWFKELFTNRKALITRETIMNASILAKYDNRKLQNTLPSDFVPIKSAILQTVEYYKLRHN